MNQFLIGVGVTFSAIALYFLYKLDAEPIYVILASFALGFWVNEIVNGYFLRAKDRIIDKYSDLCKDMLDTMIRMEKDRAVGLKDRAVVNLLDSLAGIAARPPKGVRVKMTVKKKTASKKK